MTAPQPPVINLKLPLSPYMSRREVAHYLRCHPNSVDKLAREGLLKRHRIEGLDLLLYLRKEVEGIVIEDDETFCSPRARKRATS